MGWWDTFWCWIAANSAVVEAVSTAVAAIVAVGGIVLAVSDSGARSRPIVVAFFRRAENNFYAIDFVVRNFGASIAKGVTVSFDPPLSADRSDGTSGYLVPLRYGKPIGALAPSQELSNSWFLPKIGNGNKVLGTALRCPTPYR
jgi:hypothetical protein